MILLATILAGIGAALLASHRMAQRFEVLASHARSIANNNATYGWPEFSIAEFHQLTANLKLMADSIHQREAYNRVLFSDSPIPLVVADAETQLFTDANETAVKHFDLNERSELIGKNFCRFLSESAIRRHGCGGWACRIRCAVFRKG